MSSGTAVKSAARSGDQSTGFERVDAVVVGHAEPGGGHGGVGEGEQSGGGGDVTGVRRSIGEGVEGEAEILAALPEIRRRYLLDVDAPPRMRSRYARLRGR